MGTEILDPVAFVKDLTEQVDRIKASLSSKFSSAAPAAAPVAASSAQEVIYEKTYLVKPDDEAKMEKRVRKAVERIRASQRAAAPGFFLGAEMSVVHPDNGLKVIVHVRFVDKDSKSSKELLEVLALEEENDRMDSPTKPTYTFSSRVLMCSVATLAQYSSSVGLSIAIPNDNSPAADSVSPLKGATLAAPQTPPGRKKKKRRESFSVKRIEPGEHKKVYHEKPKEARELIISAMKAKSNILFNHESDDNLEMLCDAFFRKEVAAGEIVIKEGDIGDFFYIVDGGLFDVFKQVGESYEAKEGKKPLQCMKCGATGMAVTCACGTRGSAEVFNYTERGSYFGELALFYDAPRAATVRAQGQAAVWMLDRTTCNTIIINAAHNKRNMHKAFLNDIPILKHLSTGDFAKLCDVLVAGTHQEGEEIIKQNDPGERFYIIESGTVSVVRTEGGQTLPMCDPLGKGKFFGELALLNDSPRAASVVAMEEVKVASLDRSAFNRILGELEPLKSTKDEYKSFEQIKAESTV